MQTTNQQLIAKVEELRDTHTDLANLFSASEIAVLLLTRTLQVKRMTPAVTQLLNLLPGDIGRPLSHFAPQFTGMSLLADAERVLHEQVPQEYEVQATAGVWYTLRIIPYRTLEGQVDGVVVTFTDVSRLKAGEQELIVARNYAEHIIATLREPLLVLDADLTVRSANAAFYQLFQVNASGTEGQRLYSLGNGQWDIPELRALLEQVLPEAQAVNDYEVEHSFERIGQRTLLLNARRIEADALILLVIEDITERRQSACALEEARRDAEAMQVAAEAANRAKSEFLANISHEIRTPMSAILGYADILATQIHDPDSQNSIETIRRNGRYLLEIVDDVLDLSKIEAGKFSIESELCIPEQVVNEVYALMSVRAQHQQIALIIDYDGMMPAQISTDPVRLRQILLNLIGNAIKFTECGTVRLTIRGLDQDTPRARLQFIVADTGIGITAAKLSTVFEMFQQGDTATTRRFGGTGLGLSIARQLATLLDGEISATSEPGQGSTFTLTLDIGDQRHSPWVEPRLTSSEPAELDVPLPQLTGCHVLVVDDRDDIRYLVQRLIENVNGIVSVAANGRAALAQVTCGEAEGLPFDAVVLDMQMPVMDGLETTRQLRARGFNQPIIALTAGAMHGEREKCLEAGCTDFLSKPVAGTRLIHLLANCIRAEASPIGSAPAEAVQRILVVDDNEDLATALTTLLRLSGYTVDIAFDGRSALAQASKQTPDVAILDLNLSDMKGTELLAQLKAMPRLTQTVFIALSGEYGDQTARRASGFDHQLLKPATLAELTALFSK